MERDREWLLRLLRLLLALERLLRALPGRGGPEPERRAGVGPLDAAARATRAVLVGLVVLAVFAELRPMTAAGRGTGSGGGSA